MAAPIAFNEVVVDSPAVNGLVCAYTGTPFHVVMRAIPGFVTFSAPDAFSLHEPVDQKDIPLLLLRASMRNGVAGAVSDEKRMFDAYTGARLVLTKTAEGKYYLEGGFNPRAGKRSLAEFIKYASMRDGKPTCEVSEPPKSREDVRSAPALTPHPPRDTKSEDAARMAREMAKLMGLAAPASITAPGRIQKKK